MAGKNKKIRQNILFIFVVIVLILSFLAFSISLGRVFYNYFSIIEKKEIDAFLIVSDTTGFDLNTSVLTFGKIMPGGASTRTLILENFHNFPVCAEIVPRGMIKNFVERQKFCLNSGEKKELPVSAKVNEETAYGNYTGKIMLIVREA